MQSRVVVVTGAASGIGAACARTLQARGYRVVAVDRDAETLRARAAELDIPFHVADVADEARVVALAEEVTEAHGVPWGLVASAGIVQRILPPHALPMEEFDRVIAVNLRGLYLTCREFGTRMARAGRGAIVTISSGAAYRSTTLHAYGPAKAAVVALTETLAAEWGRSGVRVTGVAPAYTMTEGIRRRGEAGERDLSAFGRDLIIGRPIAPEEIAGPVAFLLSDDAGAITGITLPVDGGLLAAGVWDAYGGLRPSMAEPEGARAEEGAAAVRGP